MFRYHERFLFNLNQVSMKKILLLVTIAVFCFGVDVLAQGTTVTGKITDAADGLPIPGANVIERGTNNGVITDMDGNFSLEVSANASLEVSYIGYATKVVPVGNRTTVNVALDLDVTQLSEVVVIGYGQIESRDVTGAVESVKSKDFNKGLR